MNSFDFTRFGSVAGRRVLDLGAGGGRHAVEAAMRGAIVVCVELDPDALEGIPSQVERATEFLGLEPGALAAQVLLIKADARALPFADGSFDLVIAAEILEHIVRDARALAEIYRVLVPGAKVGISVPRAFPEAVNWLLSKDYHAVAGGHVRIYGKRELKGKLAKVGLVEIRHTYAHGLHSPYWWLKSLVGIENRNNALVERYHRMLVGQIMGESPRLDSIEKALNPLLGKSIVFYGLRPKVDSAGEVAVQLVDTPTTDTTDSNRAD